MDYRWGTAVLAAGVLVAGCGQLGEQGGAGAPASPSGYALVEEPLPVPDGFPKGFPPPPRGWRAVSTEVVEVAWTNRRPGRDAGVVVRRIVRYATLPGRDFGEVERLREHYRDALPGSGWRITADQRLDAEDRPPGPGYLLLADGHGYLGVEVVLRRELTGPSVQVSVVEGSSGEGSAHRPTVAVPGWYDHLPGPPEGLRREQVRITTRVGEPVVYQLTYTGRQPSDAAQLRAATLASHYRHALNEGGWTVRGQRRYRDRPAVAVERRHIEITFTGHQVSGLLHASQATSRAGRRLGTSLSVTITDSDQTPGG